MKARWKITLALIGIVLVSLAVGAKLGARYAFMKLHRRNNPTTWNESAMRMLDRRLKLNPEQHQKVQALMDKRVEELQALREETVAKTNGVIEQLIGDVDKELAPEQREEFQKIKAERGQTTLDVLKVEPRKR